MPAASGQRSTHTIRQEPKDKELTDDDDDDDVDDDAGDLLLNRAESELVLPMPKALRSGVSGMYCLLAYNCHRAD